MIRVSVLYPSGEGSTFDFDYYQSTHIPMALKAWGLSEAEIDKGVNGPYVAAAHFRFESLDALNAAMGGPGTGDLMADLANFTNISPAIQTSEILS